MLRTAKPEMKQRLIKSKPLDFLLLINLIPLQSSLNGQKNLSPQFCFLSDIRGTDNTYLDLSFLLVLASDKWVVKMKIVPYV